MRTATPELVALLNGAQRLVWADLFTVSLQGGAVLRYTSADVPVTFGANTWARGPLISRGRTRLSIGVSVDDLEVTLNAGPEVQVNGKPLMTLIAGGGLDGARLTLERAFSPDWQTPMVGTIILFPGRVSDVTMGRYEARLVVRSDLELLDTMVPRNLYQPGCNNTLYDAACGVNRAAFTVAGAVGAAPAPTRQAFGSALGQAAGHFALGVVAFTSGANAGISRTVKTFAGGLVTLIAPLPFAPAVGDAFSIYPGCDKTQATCTNKFANLPRFRGQPYIPVPETVT